MLAIKSLTSGDIFTVSILEDIRQSYKSLRTIITTPWNQANRLNQPQIQLRAIITTPWNQANRFNQHGTSITIDLQYLRIDDNPSVTSLQHGVKVIWDKDPDRNTKPLLRKAPQNDRRLWRKRDTKAKDNCAK